MADSKVMYADSDAESLPSVFWLPTAPQKVKLVEIKRPENITISWDDMWTESDTMVMSFVFKKSSRQQPNKQPNILLPKPWYKIVGDKILATSNAAKLMFKLPRPTLSHGVDSRMVVKWAAKFTPIDFSDMLVSTQFKFGHLNPKCIEYRHKLAIELDATDDDEPEAPEAKEDEKKDEGQLVRLRAFNELISKRFNAHQDSFMPLEELPKLLDVMFYDVSAKMKQTSGIIDHDGLYMFRSALAFLASYYAPGSPATYKKQLASSCVSRSAFGGRGISSHQHNVVQHVNDAKDEVTQHVHQITQHVGRVEARLEAYQKESVAQLYDKGEKLAEAKTSLKYEVQNKTSVMNDYKQLQQKACELRRVNTTLNNTSVALQERIKAMQSLQEAKTEEIKVLREEVKALRDAEAAARAEVASKNVEIAKLQVQLEAAKAWESKCEAKDVEINDLNTKMRDLQVPRDKRQITVQVQSPNNKRARDVPPEYQDSQHNWRRNNYWDRTHRYGPSHCRRRRRRR
uniref:Uncharacterized protein n=1 Tax=viral metagenome TaxID=1070528 RepID=A0A6C0BQF8_9ZZZZ